MELHDGAADCTINGDDLQSERISGAAFERVTFIGVDFTDSKLSACTFNDCTFRRCEFASTIHRDCAYLGCVFVDCGFFGASLDGCKLTGSTIKGSTLRQVTARGGAWDFMTFGNVTLDGCELRDLRMTETDLTGTKTRKLMMVDCDLTNVVFEDADLRGADLRGSLVYSIDPQTALLAEAIVTAGQAVILAQNLGLDVRAD